MAAIPLFFKVIASRPSGVGVANATIRILNAIYTDVTANLLGTTTPTTDSTGVYEKFFPAEKLLPSGQTYYILINAPGFEQWRLVTDVTFIGFGVVVAEMVRSTGPVGAYSITTPPVAHLSAYYPIPIVAEVSGNAGYAWEIIRFHLTHLDGRTAIMEIPVDPITNLATADVHSRVRLHTKPNLVTDGETSLVDPDFSDFITVSYQSLSEEGIIDVPGGLLFWAANMAPRQDTNDLEEYASGGSPDGLIKWITLMDEPIVFRGYYFDVMIWLTNGEDGAQYTLHRQYLNGAYQAVGSTTTETLTKANQAQRIRIDAQPADAVMHSRLWITDADGDIITKTLTLHYRG